MNITASLIVLLTLLGPQASPTKCIEVGKWPGAAYVPFKVKPAQVKKAVGGKDSKSIAPGPSRTAGSPSGRLLDGQPDSINVSFPEVAACEPARALMRKGRHVEAIRLLDEASGQVLGRQPISDVAILRSEALMSLGRAADAFETLRPYMEPDFDPVDASPVLVPASLAAAMSGRVFEGQEEYIRWYMKTFNIRIPPIEIRDAVKRVQYLSAISMAYTSTLIIEMKIVYGRAALAAAPGDSSASVATLLPLVELHRFEEAVEVYRNLKPVTDKRMRTRLSELRQPIQLAGFDVPEIP